MKTAFALRSMAFGIAVSFALVAFSLPARASFYFKCGSYRLPAKLKLKDRDGKPLDTPYLVLFENLLSQTVIPVKLDPAVQAEIKKLGDFRMVISEFEIALSNEGVRPARGTVTRIYLDQAVPDPSNLARFRFLQPAPCSTNLSFAGR